MAKPDSKKKKIKGFKEFDGSKYINTEPVLDEAKKGTVVISWGRMNPMSAGHEKLVKKVISVAKSEKAEPHVYLTHSYGAKTKTGKGSVNKDPLQYSDKIKFAQKAFGPVVKKSNAKTIIQLMKQLMQSFNRVILVAGSDRVKEFESTLNKYNGKEYNFDDIKVVSAGQRDPDADDVSGISGTKMRGYAATDMKKFTANLPTNLKGDAEKIAALVNKGTQMKEESDQELSEALSRQQRRKRGLAMKKARFKIARGREKAKRKTASMEVLKKRARKAAINILKTKFSKARRYADMSAGEKEVIDKRIEKVSKQRLDAIAKKLLPKVKTAERERRMNLMKGGSSKNEEINETTGAYFKGVEKEKRDDRERHFNRNAKKADDDASAYKPAPGDKEAKTKESKHTKKARAMGYVEELVWEDLVEGLNEGMWGQRISKKPHMLMDKNNKVKFDKRFKMYKPKMQEDFSLNDISDLASSTEQFIAEDTDMIKFNQFINEDSDKSLKSKAEKSGMPFGVLKQVYNRGMAAWKTGHRPGTTPEQWGHARVNSFITKSSGTWGKADSDLAAKVRKEEVELDEMKQGWALIDTADGNKVKAMASSEQGVKQSKTSAERPPMSVKDKNTLKIVKLKKAVGDKQAGFMIGSPLKEEVELDEAPRRKGAPKMTGDSIAIQRAKDAEHAKAMGRSVKTGRKLPKKTMTSTQKSLASLRGEGNEQMPKTYKNIIEAATPAMKKAAASIEAYAKKHGGVDKADFMKAAKMLSSGNAGTNFVKFVDDLDTDPREWLITNLAKTMGKQTVEKMFKVKIREEVELDETLSPSEKKLVNQMYDKKGNLTAIGKKVMNHGKKPGDKGYVESIEEKNGLWANIHAKRARGEKMRKKGEKGAPTPEAIKAAQESFDEAYKITKIYNPVTKKDIAAKRSTATYAVHSHDRKYFKEFPNQKDAEKHLKSLSKKEDIDVIMSNLDIVNEVAGAGEQGTNKLVKKYKKDTPNCSD
jgi:hypothetical protein